MVPPVSPGPARMPGLATTRTSLMPAGTLNGTAGLSASARDGGCQMAAGRGVGLTERTRLVVAHVDGDGDIGREADEPDVLGLVGGAGLAGDRLADLLDHGRGAGLHHAFHQLGDLIG